MVTFDDVLPYSQNLTLLYVEDNPDAREMTSMVLEDFFNTLIVAVDGEDGLEKFQHNEVDLIITDISMPKMDGLEMIKQIRKIDDEVPILVLSAHNEDNFFIESIKLGVTGYLLKPIDIDQLTSNIYNVVQKYKYKQEAKNSLYLLKEYQEATNLSSIVSKTDTKGIITFVNDAFCEISGYTRDELIGKNHNIIRHPDNPSSIFKEIWHTIKDEKKVWKGIVRNRKKDGSSYYVRSVIMPITNIQGEIIEYISLRTDITDIMNPARLLSDALKNAHNLALVYVKLENYDSMLDFFDTQTIQEIEEKAQKHLEQRFSEYLQFDKIYHLNNGEFAFIIHKDLCLADEKRCVDLLKQCQHTIHNDKIILENVEYDINILLSVSYDDDKILESVKLGIHKLIKHNNNFIIANNLANKEQEVAQQNMKTVAMIKAAILNSKIISYFQPIIDNNTQEVVKYESLVRLIDQNGKVISPFFFLDIAKKSNYYTKITNIVLEYAFSILDACNKDISINLSVLDIEQTSTRLKVYELLEQHKTKAPRIVFELLEDENVKDFQLVKDFISRVKEYGVKIAIDDFGAGYSNFERLLDYQPDILKIDGCLIRDIETSTYSLSVVKSIVTFAQEQNIQTIAEYIENESIFNIVKDLGVDFSQGYYFGKPGPLDI
jgi:PAS domain S-box-containing protein